MRAHKWLMFAAVFTEVAGVLTVVGALTPGALDPILALAFGEPVAVDAPVRLAGGIAGAVMAGWGATLALLARSIDSLSPHVLGTATAVGISMWFVLDSLVSVVNGAAFNVAGNVIFLVMLLVPALMLRGAPRSHGGGASSTPT